MTAVRPRRPPVRDTLDFLSLWLRRPRSIGAVLPSSDVLAAAIASEIDTAAPGAVVELGGGTGSITAALLKTATAPEDLVVVEREALLCARLSARFPNVRVICGDARNLRALLDQAQVRQVKAVVSGLPLLTMSERFCREVMTESFAVLPPDGQVLQFTYGLAPPVRRSVGRDLGIVGRRAGWVLRNLPPAALWLYRREAHMAEMAA